VNAVWAFIPVFLAAVLIGFLMVYLSREKRMKRRRNIFPSQNPVWKKVAPDPKGGQTIGNPETFLPSNTPVHRVGRIEVPRFTSTHASSGDTIVLGASTGNKVCPYCMDPIAPQDVFTCPGCKTAHHRTCWDTYKGCSVLACKQAPTKSY
jgi:hypothetical protein